MNKSIQVKAKEKIQQLMDGYDVAYIDYNARDDSYMISLENSDSEVDEELEAKKEPNPPDFREG